MRAARLTGMLWRRRGLPAAASAGAALAAAALVLAYLGGSARAGGATAAGASYAALTGDEPSGLPLVAARDRNRPGAPEGPTWPAEPPEGAGPNWPLASTIRRLPLSDPKLSAWIASSIEGGICVLLSDGVPVKGVSAVYSSCSAEGRLDRGASVEVSDIPGMPGRYLAAGVVPNGVTEVHFAMLDGSTYAASVQGNAWVRDTNGPAASGRLPTMIGGE